MCLPSCQPWPSPPPRPRRACATASPYSSTAVPSPPMLHSFRLSLLSHFALATAAAAALPCSRSSISDFKRIGRRRRSNVGQNVAFCWTQTFGARRRLRRCRCTNIQVTRMREEDSEAAAATTSFTLIAGEINEEKQ
jgi:hypothetical protein